MRGPPAAIRALPMLLRDLGAALDQTQDLRVELVDLHPRSAAISSSDGISRSAVLSLLVMAVTVSSSLPEPRPGRENAPGPMDSGACVGAGQQATGTGVRYP